jgi:CheY-like chemotaxis protein
MGSRILVVEDEILVALELEATAQDLGHEVIGIAADTQAALRLAPWADIALVDVNLRDGETGPAIGRRLAQEYGITVVFVTANPAQLGEGVPGALGVVSKPCDERMTAQVISFAQAHRDRMKGFEPPAQITLFDRVGA